MPLLAFGAMALWDAGSADREQLKSLLTSRLSSFDFIEQHRATLVPRWLLTSLAEYLHSEPSLLRRRLTDRSALLAVLPCLLTMLCFGLQTFKIKLASRESLLIACVVLAPLSMHVIAWDTLRIWTYSIFAAFAVHWVLAETVASPRSDDLSWFRILALATVVLNVLIAIPLMDDQADRFTSLERLLVYAPVLVGSTLLALPARRGR